MKHSKANVVFVESLTDKVFKVLPLYEEQNPTLPAYLDSLVSTLDGYKEYASLNNDSRYLFLVGSIYGLKPQITQVDNQKVVKREVFKCIRLIRDFTDIYKIEGV